MRKKMQEAMQVKCMACKQTYWVDLQVVKDNCCVYCGGPLAEFMDCQEDYEQKRQLEQDL